LKYTFQIGGIFRSAPFGGDQLAVRPDAAGIATEGMQKMPRRCPGNIYRKGGKPNSSEPARAGCARDVRSRSDSSIRKRRSTPRWHAASAQDSSRDHGCNTN
jgi:hypothetical protein